MESDHNIPPSRTIDDFLDQIYKEYKRRLPSPSISHLIFKPWHYRHYLPLPLLALCVANSSDATEILMLSYLLANTTFKKQMFGESNVDDDISSMEGSEYLAASIFLGMLIGGTCLGFLSDHIGRRPSLLIGLLTNAIAGFFSSLPFLTPTIAQLTFWRFIAGIGIGAGVPSLFALASECSPKEVRGSVVTLVASFWMIGSLFVSAIAWILFRGDSDNEQDIQQYHNAISMWRIFAALCALPSGLGAWLVYLYVPESARFLASSKQKYYQSAHVCNQLAISLDIKLGSTADRVGGDNEVIIKDDLLKGESGEAWYDSNYTVCIQPLTEDELRQDYHDSIISTDAASITSLTVRFQQTIHMLLDSLKRLYSPKLRADTTIPLQLLWFCLSFATYGITTWINTLFVSVHLQNIYFNSFLFALANLPGNIISIMYSDSWGRKKMLVGSLLGAASGLLSFAFLIYHGNNDGDDQSNKGIVLCACLFQMFSIISWNSIDILSSECFPTSVRSAGMGMCTACGRFGGIFAQFVNARLMMIRDNEGTSSSASVLVVACVTLLVSAGLPMFLRTDMTLVELKDEIIDSEESTSKRSITLGCIGNSQTQKDHLSDTEEDYQSLRQETFLL